MAQSGRRTLLAPGASRGLRLQTPSPREAVAADGTKASLCDWSFWRMLAGQQSRRGTL